MLYAFYIFSNYYLVIIIIVIFDKVKKIYLQDLAEVQLKIELDADLNIILLNYQNN